MQDTVLTSSRPPCDACAAGIHCFGGRCPCCCREPEPGQSAQRILCAHADQDGQGAHWLEPGETCPGAQLAADAARAERDRQDWDQEHAAEPAAAEAEVRDGARLAAIRATLAELGGVGSIAGKLLAEAIERIDQLANSSRTASGIEPDGSVHITVRDVPLVVAGLADAADLLEHRAGQFCPGCEKHPAELCEEHAADLGHADAYRTMLAKLTEHAADPGLAGIYDSALAKLTGSTS
jgi:hypothetical protein